MAMGIRKLSSSSLPIRAGERVPAPGRYGLLAGSISIDLRALYPTLPATLRNVSLLTGELTGEQASAQILQRPCLPTQTA
jgi:hypothetical protein